MAEKEKTYTAGELEGYDFDPSKYAADIDTTGIDYYDREPVEAGDETNGKKLEPIKRAPAALLPRQPRSCFAAPVPTVPFSGKTIGDVEDFIKGRIAYHQSLEESAEDKAKRERRERNYRRLAAIGDLLGGMHRAYSYARGIQPMAMDNLTDKARERIDKAKAEREKNAAEILNYVVTLNKLGDSKRTAGYQQEMLELKRQEQARKDRQEERNQEVAQARAELYRAQQDKNVAQIAYYETKTKLLEAGWPLEQVLREAQIAKNKAQAAKASASSGGSQGWVTKNKKIIDPVSGKVIGYTTERTPLNARDSGGQGKGGGKPEYSHVKNLGL